MSDPWLKKNKKDGSPSDSFPEDTFPLSATEIEDKQIADNYYAEIEEGLSQSQREDREKISAAGHRDLSPDEFDGNTNDALHPQDDRVRGAGGQSLDDIVLNNDVPSRFGLAEHEGGIRHDRPEPNVNSVRPIKKPA